MFFRIADMWFRARQRRHDGRPLSRPVLFDQDAPDGNLLVPAGKQFRRWGALLTMASLALPGVAAARLAEGGPTQGAVVEAGRTGRQGSPVSPDADGADAAAGTEVASGVGAGGDLPGGDAWVTLPGAAHAAGIEGTPPGPRATAAAPWAGGVVDADGKPLPTAPPPGPVPVDGIPQPAAAGWSTTTSTRTTGTTAAAPKGTPAPGETARSAPNRTVAASAGRDDDLVPADREYLRPILIRYAQENGLPADVVMSLAWVESSWRRNAASDAGAIGVMQLMPNTAEYVSKKLLGLRNTLDPRNPTSNVRMGARYLRHLLDQSRGSVRQALIAYNQGITSLRANGSYRVAERYADRVLALRPQFRSW